jgi:hypothetical protein
MRRRIVRQRGLRGDIGVYLKSLSICSALFSKLYLCEILLRCDGSYPAASTMRSYIGWCQSVPFQGGPTAFPDSIIATDGKYCSSSGLVSSVEYVPALKRPSLLPLFATR